jgi:patatin-like phospholipase/acyl hydrolase
MAGTSTGGIIVLGIGTACKDGQPYSPAELVDLYVQNGSSIFSKNLLTPEKEVVRPKYSPDALEAALAEFFGDTQFHSALTPLAARIQINSTSCPASLALARLDVLN